MLVTDDYELVVVSRISVEIAEPSQFVSWWDSIYKCNLRNRISCAQPESKTSLPVIWILGLSFDFSEMVELYGSRVRTVLEGDKGWNPDLSPNWQQFCASATSQVIRL